MMSKNKFLVVEGPIGVGKTTLATKLSSTFNSKLILENFSENPFLKHFYRDPKRYALPTQVSFLLQRSSELKNIQLKEMAKTNLISDYFINKDKLFAETNLNKEELVLYNKIYQGLDIPAVKPSLIIYLQADAATLIKRIKSRREQFESAITEGYLQSVIDAYTNYFHNYNECPILIINTSNVNINKSNDYIMLVEEINKNIKGKKYFNPSTLRS